MKTSKGVGCHAGVDAAGAVPVAPEAQITAPVDARKAVLVILGRATSRNYLPAGVLETLEPGSTGVIDQPLGRFWIDFGGGGDLAGLRLGQVARLAGGGQRRLRFHLLCDGQAGSGCPLGGSRQLRQPLLG